MTTGVYPSFVISDAVDNHPAHGDLGHHLTRRYRLSVSVGQIGNSARTGRRVRFSGLSRTTRSMATVRARCDMDEITGLDSFEPVPDTAWHDVRITRSQQNLHLGADRPLVTVVKYQFHRSAHDVQELVAVRMDLATMWSRPIDVGDCSDCVSIDSSWRSRWGRSDGHRPVPSDVRNTPFEVDRRRIWGISHAPRLPVLEPPRHRTDCRYQAGLPWQPGLAAEVPLGDSTKVGRRTTSSLLR